MNEVLSRAAVRAAVWSFLFSPVGLALAVKARRRYEENGVPVDGLLQFALWNSILGLVTTALIAVMLALVIAAIPPSPL